MVQVGKSTVVRRYERRDLTPMRDLAFYNFRAHTHLDWQTVYEYLQSDPERTWVVTRGEAVVAAMSLSEPISGCSWVRLLFLHDDEALMDVLPPLWMAVTDELRGEGVQQVAALLIRNWMQDWAQAQGFQYVEDIVTLRYQQRDLPPVPPRPNLTFHPIELTDLKDIHKLDVAAFHNPWRMTLRETRLGVRVGVYCTMARDGERVAGYQIATTHGMNGHLARLGVAPMYQKRGIGGWLVHDMLRFFHERDVYSVTVNTQGTNVKSQRLYERFGFARNGYDLPVWTIRL